MTRSILFAAVAVSMFSVQVAKAQTGPNTFVGSTTNWFDVANWSLGRVPAAGDDVAIGGGKSVVIDPANDPSTATAGKVIFQDIHIFGGATLETLAGVQFTARNELVDTGGRLIHRATRATEAALGGSLTVLPSPATAGGLGGISLNPTTKSKRIIVLQSSVTVGLGGTTPASNLVPDAYGAGHYATLTCTTADLGGTLDLELYYGFTPVVGQSFKIIDVGETLTGRFTDLREGAMAEAFGDVGLFISYAGGDGNDVVLTAAVVPEPAAMGVLSLAGLSLARRRRR